MEFLVEASRLLRKNRKLLYDMVPLLQKKVILKLKENSKHETWLTKNVFDPKEL